jgi:predicted nucleic acid-binding protein
MITALDTNILLDILAGDERFQAASLHAVEQAASRGSLVICDLVYAELSLAFLSQKELDRFLDENSIEVQSLNRSALFQAGLAWKAYRRHGGPRARVLADFLIGAHADVQSSQLLSRDRGFYRKYFSSLPVLDPSSSKRT